MRLLLADDEPIEREALRFLLEGALPGVTIVGEAASGREAVALVESLRPDVILLDIEMPGLNGLEALRLIRERAPSTRCLVISAYDTFQYAREAMRGGAVDYLLKPVRAEQMIEVLGRLTAAIEAERRGRDDALRQLEQIRQLRPLAEAELVHRVERGEVSSGWAELLEATGHRLQAGLAVAVAIEGAQLGQAHLWLTNQVRALTPCAVGALQEDRFLILVEQEAPLQAERLRSWSHDLARTLRERAWEVMRLRLRVGIGSPATGPADLHRSAVEALAALRHGPEPDEGAARDRSAPSPAAVRAVEEGRRYMQARFNEPLTLEQIAGHLALSPQYYSKLFTRLTGQTVMEFLTDCRMAEAKRLLADPIVPVKEVGFRIGYQDPNYFTRVFKKVTGQTPTEYRADRLGAPPRPAQS